MAWAATVPADASTPATEASKVRDNWAAIAAGTVPQTGTYVETFFIGKNADSDIKLEADNGDASNPFIMYDASANEWVVSHDGSTTTALGAVPSSSVLLFVGTSCPTGYTDITVANDDRYLRATVLASAAVETGGTLNETVTISGTTSTPSATINTGGNTGAVYAADDTCTHTFSDTDTVTHTPLYSGFLLCLKD